MTSLNRIISLLLDNRIDFSLQFNNETQVCISFPDYENYDIEYLNIDIDTQMVFISNYLKRIQGYVCISELKEYSPFTKK